MLNDLKTKRELKQLKKAEREARKLIKKMSKSSLKFMNSIIALSKKHSTTCQDSLDKLKETAKQLTKKKES